MGGPSRRLTRRQFNRGVAAAVASAPSFVPREVLGSEDHDAPSERITIGFIGMGKMNRHHLNHFLNQQDVQVLAVCDVDTTRRDHARHAVDSHYGKKVAATADGGCAAYVDFRDLLARDDIDAVVIATPDHWHASPVLEACRTGKDIYCEKPLTLTIREAERMIAAVRKYGRVFQTGSQQRSSQEFWRACSLVRSGRIGTVQTVNVNVGGPSRWCDLPEEPLEKGLDWDRWLGPAPERPYHSVLSPRGIHDHFPNWRAYREYSGGGMTDWGAHHFDIAQWGLDMDASGPEKIVPPEDAQAHRGLRYVYASGVEMVHGPGEGVQFIGTDGEITVNRGRLSSTPQEIIEEPLSDGDVILRRSTGHARDWLNCIRTRERPICDVEIGARSVTVCHLGNLAYWNGRILHWDPQAWQFVNDAEANTWLDRQRREPWQLPAV